MTWYNRKIYCLQWLTMLDVTRYGRAFSCIFFRLFFTRGFHQFQNFFFFLQYSYNIPLFNIVLQYIVIYINCIFSPYCKNLSIRIIYSKKTIMKYITRIKHIGSTLKEYLEFLVAVSMQMEIYFVCNIYSRIKKL